MIVEDVKVSAPKTKELVEQLGKLGAENVLIVVGEMDNNLWLAARNLHKVGLTEAAAIDPVVLIKHDKVLMTVSALKKIEEMLA